MWALIYIRGDGDPGRHPLEWMNGTSGEGGAMGFVWDGAERCDRKRSARAPLRNRLGLRGGVCPRSTGAAGSLGAVR